MSIIEVLRLLFSRESRETVAHVVRRVRASPEWKRDLVVFRETFRVRQKSYVPVFVGYIQKLLALKGWADDDTKAVRFICLELTKNAFEHGLRDNRKGSITVHVQASSDFFEVEVADPGPGFDLSEELARQGASDAFSPSCRALGFIYRLANELCQGPRRNTVRALFRTRYKPCIIRTVDGVTLFQFQGETEPSGYFWAQIVNEIESLSPESKVILDFSDVEDVGTRAVSEIMELLAHRGLLEMRDRAPRGAAAYLSLLAGEERVVVAGTCAINPALREFLGKHFTVFPTAADALRSWRESQGVG